MDQLLKLASQLTKRLRSTQAAIVLVLVVLGLIAIQLAGVASAFPYFLVVAGVAIVIVLILLVLDRIDSSVSVKGLDEGDRAAVRAVLSAARDEVARILGSDRARCRGNIVAENRLRRLQISRDLMVNMDGVGEWQISMRPGRGSAGVAWSTRQPHVAIHPFEGTDGLEPDQARLVDPEVRWIISVPILAEDGKPTWIVNIDGKDARGREQVEAAVPTLQDRVCPVLPSFAAKA
ncbi:MAG TPA: hypothetical protein VF729_00450 [Solirubrobacterales bacterium]